MLGILFTLLQTLLAVSTECFDGLVASGCMVRFNPYESGLPFFNKFSYDLIMIGSGINFDNNLIFYKDVRDCTDSFYIRIKPSTSMSNTLVLFLVPNRPPESDIPEIYNINSNITNGDVRAVSGNVATTINIQFSPNVASTLILRVSRVGTPTSVVKTANSNLVTVNSDAFTQPITERYFGPWESVFDNRYPSTFDLTLGKIFSILKKNAVKERCVPKRQIERMATSAAVEIFQEQFCRNKRPECKPVSVIVHEYLTCVTENFKYMEKHCEKKSDTLCFEVCAIFESIVSIGQYPCAEHVQPCKPISPIIEPCKIEELSSESSSEIISKKKTNIYKTRTQAVKKAKASTSVWVYGVGGTLIVVAAVAVTVWLL